ncbi:MAG TPA: DUF4286 family protein [Niastella sp.]
MIVYNITIKILPAIEDAWLQWQQQEHIPEIMASGQFSQWKMFRLLEQDDTDGLTFVVQYFAPTIENYLTYIEEFAPVLRQKAFDKWGNRFIAFQTVMQVVN